MKHVVAVALCGLTGAGCASPPDDATATVTVFAAASLKSPFTELGARFETDHPGTRVTFNFAGSSDLVAQLTQGAPADVFASADTANMAKAVEAGLVSGAPADFATNTLTIVTPPGNPGGITSFADLGRPGIQVVVCAPQVPCGAAAEKIEDATGVTLTPVSEESAVTDVLGKVTSGQADAGLVYVTDAAVAGDKVTPVHLAESGAAVNTYPVATLAGSPNPPAARQFVDLVTGPQGREVLSAAGFGPP
ncbi:molybdate ABC transporter substrate-binding protein [Mycobacterium sp. NAZ190054]|uniref:molybdate ABC transporter substrate-binding protein n=1 Tax=Mycobacterium sp. NAZ190054 TaxID=1747766 RepID=UPI00079CC8A1|nr:molybdate ABC transporter substrate-binding protein [Mycobacterium sp. NAZ190054]KWX68703.1 molybdate-binding protein [Mycobacterium sp. NAZ190054]